MFATVSIMRRGGAAERGRLAKVAVRSHWRCSTLSLSLSFTLSRTLAFSPSITLFADHHHHRHTIKSVFVCVLVSNWLMQLISELTSPQIHQLCFFFSLCLCLYLFSVCFTLAKATRGKGQTTCKICIYMHKVYVFLRVYSL